jgi:hypothetical protein
MLIVSCGEGEWRLEATAVSGVDDGLTALRFRARKWSQWVRGGEGKARSREGAPIAARPRRNLELMLPVMAESGEESRGLAASLQRGKERDERGETGVLIAGLLMTLTCEITAGSKSLAFPVTERKGREIGGEERADMRVPSVGEREGER